MSQKSIGSGLVALLVLVSVIYLVANKKTDSDVKSEEPVAAVNESQTQHESRSDEYGSQTSDVKIRPIDSTKVASKVEAISSSKIEPEQTKSSPFTDDNFDDWVKLGSADFIEEKVTNPEKYKAGVDFLINTLKTGNVDKMLSQAAGTLFNINDPDLTPVYEGILNDPDANISPEGMMRILTLYIHQGQPESPAFKQIIAKYKNSSNNSLKAVANQWQQLR